MSTKRFYFHIEVEDCYWEEVDNPNPEALEAETIKHVAKLFNATIKSQGRRHDGALICFFTADDICGVKQTIIDNQLVEGNDQIVAGEYVIVRDFMVESAEPLKRGEKLSFLGAPVRFSLFR